jgi:ribonuclease P protein component
MASDFSFSKKFRLHSRRVFDLVFNAGSRSSTRDLVMWVYAAGAKEIGSKLGLVISKKTGGAVRRNRLKRLLREAFRLSKSGLMDGTRIIIYPKAGCRIQTLSEARNALSAIWARAKITNAER